MTHLRRILIHLTDCALLGVLTLSFWAPSLTASSHPSPDFYDAKWRFDVSPTWHFTNEVPSGNLRDRVEDGSQEWNMLPPSMHFNKGSEVGNYAWNSCGPNGDGTNGVHWGAMDGKNGAWGITHMCVYDGNPDRMYSFQIRFDQAEDWYNDTGNPPSDKLDSKGASAHEFGHGTGFSGHFAAGGAACDQPKSTMCPFMEYGQDFMRTLEEHDKHTFGNAYN